MQQVNPTEITSPSNVPEVDVLIDNLCTALEFERTNMREIGNDLHTLKKSLKGHEAFYGEWGPLLKKRFSLNYKTAQNYMYYSEAADWAEGKGKLENFSKLTTT